MKLGYMTNGFGPLVGDGGGVTSVKDIRYLTLCDDEAVLKQITDVGFRYIEVLEGNLTKYVGGHSGIKRYAGKIQRRDDERLRQREFHLQGRPGG